jgi:hypothetical protein
LKVRLLDDNEVLLAFREQILELFEKCFSRPLQETLWDWAYLNNPSGKSIVAIAEEHGEIVGHYAMIPMPFLLDDRHITGYLSMTTMVRPDFQGKGLFKLLAQEVYKTREEDSFVYGFPNSKSIEGFKKYLGWNISNEYSLIKIASRYLLESSSLLVQSTKSACKLDLDNSAFLKWRISKPITSYQAKGKFIYKNYDDSVDLVSFDFNLDKKLILKFPTVSILTSDLELIKRASYVRNYPYGSRTFSTKDNFTSPSPTMLMSDIF